MRTGVPVSSHGVVAYNGMHGGYMYSFMSTLGISTSYDGNDYKSGWLRDVFLTIIGL
jgi:hypothetical protein